MYSWDPSYGVLESQHFVDPNITRHFLHEVITLNIIPYRDLMVSKYLDLT